MGKFCIETWPQPFSSVIDYINLQVEVGPAQPNYREIIDSPYGRHFRWIVGYSAPGLTPVYVSSMHHCIGANFHLGEGHHCSSSSVIMVPMFPFHHEKSSTQISEVHRFNLKKNVVVIDADANINFAAIQEHLHNMGLVGINYLIYIFFRMEVAASIFNSECFTMSIHILLN